MRLFKPTYRNSKGKIKEVKKWWIETRDHLGTIRRFAGTTDKETTALLGRKIKKLIGYKKAGERPDELSDWLNNLDSKMRQRFVELGLLNPERVEAGKPLTEHLKDFEKYLHNRNNTDVYINIIIARINKVFNGCKFIYWSDINANQVDNYLAELRDKGNGISIQTSNHYLTHLKEFCKWMTKNHRAKENPLSILDGLNVRTDRRHDRRALSVDELRRLLETTKTQPEQLGMSGYERYMLYRLAVETGLRRNELKSLKVSSFDFNNLTVTVEAGYSKHRREDVLPLRADTASELKTFLLNKLPDVQAFNVPKRSSEMIKADLEAAGIPYVDQTGRYADFHSLRHNTGSLLCASGVQPKTAQAIMRHSDISLTMNIYSHVLQGQETQAVESLPDLSLPSKQAQQTLKNLA